MEGKKNDHCSALVTLVGSLFPLVRNFCLHVVVEPDEEGIWQNGSFHLFLFFIFKAALNKRSPICLCWAYYFVFLTKTVVKYCIFGGL